MRRACVDRSVIVSCTHLTETIFQAMNFIHYVGQLKIDFKVVYIEREPLRLCPAVFSNISWLKLLRTLISFTVTRDESPLKRSITDISNFNGITSIQLEVRS